MRLTFQVSKSRERGVGRRSRCELASTGATAYPEATATRACAGEEKITNYELKITMRNIDGKGDKSLWAGSEGHAIKIQKFKNLKVQRFNNSKI